MRQAAPRANPPLACFPALQAFACAKEPMALGTGKAVAVAKTHGAAEPKEKRRVEAAGGAVGNDGLLNGLLPVARSLGDAAAKAQGKGLVPTPEVGSFEASAHLLPTCLLVCLRTCLLANGRMPACLLTHVLAPPR